MTDQPLTLQTTRERAIDVLCKAFAEDAISMAELDRRLDAARSARTRDELNSLLADLQPATAVPATRAATDPAPAERVGQAGEQTDVARSERRSSHFAFAVMGGTRRAGRWVPPRTMAAVAIMGGVELDFREAVLKPGVTDINVFAFWGGVEIVVPPNVHVDSNGIAIMGGFAQLADRESDPPPDAPVIRVNGLALMAGVEIRVREVGEDVKEEKA